MYKFKKNAKTGELEMVKGVEFNIHPSIAPEYAETFRNVFEREYARFEYCTLLAKQYNNTETLDEIEKRKLLEINFFNSPETFVDYATRNACDLSDLDSSVRPLMIYTLFAHGKLLKRFYLDADTDECKIESGRLSLGLDDFYHECKNTVLAVENGSMTLEDGVQAIKPLYRDNAGIVNHGAAEGVCKKWTASTKEKCARAFLVGLLSRYKLTRSNKLKADSPLKSIKTFEKYFLTWAVTDGVMADPKKKVEKKRDLTIDEMISALTK